MIYFFGIELSPSINVAIVLYNATTKFVYRGTSPLLNSFYPNPVCRLCLFKKHSDLANSVETRPDPYVGLTRCGTPFFNQGVAYD